jgi:DNA-binding NarL/FixJ family response regulator
MTLRGSVAAALDSQSADAGLADALALVCDELEPGDRISLHAVDQLRQSFRVIAGAGADLLANGTELPLETSTQVLVPARGAVFRSPRFADDPTFDRVLDQLVYDMGFRSGCSVPLYLGPRPIGALCVSSRRTDLDCDPIAELLEQVTTSIAFALSAQASANVIRVLVCHDDPLVAEGMARVLEHALAVEAKVCTTPQDAQRHCEQRGERIDTIVCDSFFCDGRVHSFLRELRVAGTSAPALVVASSDSPLGRSLALRSGAAAYATRSDGPAAIVEAVRNLAAGQTSGLERPATANDGALEHLTPQEARVLLALERGLRFKQMALDMGITEATAKGYARNLFAKLGVHSRGEAVYEARRLGMLDFLNGDARAVPMPLRSEGRPDR